MTELEKKLILSKEEYEFLIKHFGYDNTTPSKPIIKQINYYYDTDDLSMNRQNVTCRIRFKDGKYKGTIKRHLPNSEHSTETDVKVYDGILKNAFMDMGLKLQGELITERCIILKDAGCEVVLDKNDYLCHTDYELEIEYAAEHEKDAQTIMKTFKDMLIRRNGFLSYKEDPTYTPKVPSKSSRFFEKKKTKLIN